MLPPDKRTLKMGALSILLALFICAWAADEKSMTGKFVLYPDSFRHYVDAFNAYDEEIHPTWISNAESWSFLRNNIPLIDVPDKRMEQIYYFRWWTFRKHIKLATPGGAKWSFVITEFLPTVKWAGLHNTIPCAAAHHIREGRWLHNTTFAESYLRFWTSSDGGNPTQYSFWLASSVRALALVSGTRGKALSIELLPKLVAIYEKQQTNNFDEKTGLFFNTDNRDGMELSIGGGGGTRAFRPTLNSYMFGDALSIAKIASSAGGSANAAIAQKFRTFASRLRVRVEKLLWDPVDRFFKVLSYKEPRTLAPVKELIGYTPWYFHLPQGASSAVAWLEFSNATGFSAPHGLTTAVQRHPHFSTSYSWLTKRGAHECQWNGPVWPYATSITLTGLANLLNTGAGSRQGFVTKGDYFRALQRYAYSHQRRLSADSAKPPAPAPAPAPGSGSASGSASASGKVRAANSSTTSSRSSNRSRSSSSSGRIDALASKIASSMKPSAKLRVGPAVKPKTRVKAKAPAPVTVPATTVAVDAKRRRLAQTEAISRAGTGAKAVKATTALHPAPLTLPWIDENLHPYSGDWIARTVLRQADWPEEKGGKERGKDYNHSTFVDLIITGLLGLRPRKDGLDVNPLVPMSSAWDYFCIDRVRMHDHWVTVLYDKTGLRYNKGKGLSIYVDGELVAHTPTIQKIAILL